MERKKIIKAAAAQISPVLDDCMATTEKVVDTISETGSKGADIIVFPETFIPNYPYFSFIKPPVLSGKDHLKLYEQAVVVPGPVTDQVSAAARKHQIVVVLGVNERDHGTIYNTQLIFDTDGAIVLKRRKITP